MISLSRVWRKKVNSYWKEEQEKRLQIYQDVLRAHAEWETAQMYFEYAVEHDQIDYAIYMLEAAERKYQIQLRQAKKIKLNWFNIDRVELKRNV